ncbi:MAG: hypothetical protein PHE93_01670 [Clostridia bacterium]|nr:hypothetical protein [Clostridia bacterium]
MTSITICATLVVENKLAPVINFENDTFVDISEIKIKQKTAIMM